VQVGREVVVGEQRAVLGRELEARHDAALGLRDVQLAVVVFAV
jgi:hypothetical protein